MIFTVGQHVVHNQHGVAIVRSIEIKDVLGVPLAFLELFFERSAMTLRTPEMQARALVRHLSDVPTAGRAIAVLAETASTSSAPWHRRARAMEAAINSGSLVAAAQVVRDLGQTESVYSMEIRQKAAARLIDEIRAIDLANNTTLSAALNQALKSLREY